VPGLPVPATTGQSHLGCRLGRPRVPGNEVRQEEPGLVLALLARALSPAAPGVPSRVETRPFLRREGAACRPAEPALPAIWGIGAGPQSDRWEHKVGSDFWPPNYNQ